MNQITELAFTDLIVALVLLFYAANGWYRGVVRTLLGPMALIICFIGGHIYFLKTYDFWISFFIIVIGPFFLTIALSMLLNLWNKHLDRGLPPFLLSRFLGAAAGAVWGGGYVILMLIILSILPIRFEKWINIKNDISHSYSNKVITKFLKNKIPYLKGIESAVEASQKPEKLEELKQTPEFQAVYSDPKMQEIFTDAVITQQIKDKDIPSLLTNPKILAAWQDPEVAKKILQLQDVMAKSGIEVSPKVNLQKNSL